MSNEGFRAKKTGFAAEAQHKVNISDHINKIGIATSSMDIITDFNQVVNGYLDTYIC